MITYTEGTLKKRFTLKDLVLSNPLRLEFMRDELVFRYESNLLSYKIFTHQYLRLTRLISLNPYTYVPFYGQNK